MELKQITDRLKELEKIVDPAEANIISSYLNGFITDYEETLFEMDLIVSNKWLSLREAAKSNNQADRLLEISEEYRKRERVKLTISQLKRLRADLKSRFEILTQIKRY